MILALAPISIFQLIFLIVFFIVFPFVLYEIKNPRTIMYEEKIKSPYFARLENTGRLKIKQYYFFDFILKIIIIDEGQTKKYFYIRKFKRGQYLKVFKTANKLK